MKLCETNEIIWLQYLCIVCSEISINDQAYFVLKIDVNA